MSLNPFEDDQVSFGKLLVWFVLFIAIAYGIGFITTGGDYFLYRFWEPKMENARTQVFHNTQAYVDGKTTYLSSLQLQYESATGAQKAALRTMILREASTVNNSRLPLDLQNFINSLKGESNELP